MKPILEIQNVSKRFRIHHEKQSYLNFRDSLSSLFKKSTDSIEVFYALDDISFNVNPGDSIGIIGKNGAGKSTLLKILSKITPPSSGKIISRGRIASLLEVGTGFHAELSGRENIFLNGSILGMRKTEIQNNFDAIVDFSGVEKFLDTPLKHYSSGMQLRLAFAVSAFLENEIMIIDEVLAVGDAEFQKKCMGKMEDVSKNQGRTVLFVSHNLEAISNLCTTSILLQNGKLISNNSTSEIISEYIKHKSKTTHWEQTEPKERGAFFKNVSVHLKGKQPTLQLHINFTISSIGKYPDAFVAFNVTNELGQTLGQAIPNPNPFIILNNSETQHECVIELNGFIPSKYFIGAWLTPGYTSNYDWQSEIVSFEVSDSPQPERSFPFSHLNGYLLPHSHMI